MGDLRTRRVGNREDFPTHDAEGRRAGFADAAEKQRDGEHSEWATTLHRLSEQRAGSWREIVDLGHDHGDDVDESGNVAAAVHRSWIALKDALTRDEITTLQKVGQPLRPASLRTRRRAWRHHAANSFEDAFVRANTARLVGTNRPNRLSTDACSTRIEGLGGNDRITAFNNTGYDRAGNKCTGQDKVSARIFGGPGHDMLKGSKAEDLIIGGPGHDKANGDLERDICQAEVRKNCEVARR